MISAESISIAYEGKVVVQDFSLEISPGKIVALVGPNGSGKTSVLNALSGNLPLVSGGIFIDGLGVESIGIPQLAKLRAVALQNQRFSLAYSVKDILLMAIEKSGDEASIAKAVEALDISELLARKITSLSGGEQQRVCIAMALAQATPYILLDEPFAAQDIESAKRIVQHVKSLAKLGVGILIVAHMNEKELTWSDSIKRIAK
ncbi:MAG: ABC transporter ATP-binding protein [Actinomycetota bacterium]